MLLDTQLRTGLLFCIRTAKSCDPALVRSVRRLAFLTMLLAGCAAPSPPIVETHKVVRHHRSPSNYCATCGVVGSRISFDRGSSTLHAEARATLGSQVAWLKRFPTIDIVIDGSGDDRDTEDHALALGYRRANADRDFLVNHGIASDRITVVSYGKEYSTPPGHHQKVVARGSSTLTYVLGH